MGCCTGEWDLVRLASNVKRMHRIQGTCMTVPGQYNTYPHYSLSAPQYPRAITHAFISTFDHAKSDRLLDQANENRQRAADLQQCRIVEAADHAAYAFTRDRHDLVDLNLGNALQTGGR